MSPTVVRAGRHLLGVVVALAWACSGPNEIDGEVTSLIVRGAVDDDTGGPVAGAIVTVSWLPGPCGDELQPFPPDTTSSAGEFAVNAWGWGTYTEACVDVRAAPPEGRALQESTIRVEKIPLDPAQGPDTLSLRLTLNPI